MEYRILWNIGVVLSDFYYRIQAGLKNQEGLTEEVKDIWYLLVTWSKQTLFKVAATHQLLPVNPCEMWTHAAIFIYLREVRSQYIV